jgi:hypothetical protein
MKNSTDENAEENIWTEERGCNSKMRTLTKEELDSLLIRITSSTAD